jgi:hypothetical protein
METPKEGWAGLSYGSFLKPFFNDTLSESLS